jgi:hypothetical protein
MLLVVRWNNNFAAARDRDATRRLALRYSTSAPKPHSTTTPPQQPKRDLGVCTTSLIAVIAPFWGVGCFWEPFSQAESGLPGLDMPPQPHKGLPPRPTSLPLIQLTNSPSLLRPPILTHSHGSSDGSVPVSLVLLLLGLLRSSSSYHHQHAAAAAASRGFPLAPPPYSIGRRCHLRQCLCRPYAHEPGTWVLYPENARGLGIDLPLRPALVPPSLDWTPDCACPMPPTRPRADGYIKEACIYASWPARVCALHVGRVLDACHQSSSSPLSLPLLPSFLCCQSARLLA